MSDYIMRSYPMYVTLPRQLNDDMTTLHENSNALVTTDFRSISFNFV